MRALQPFKLLLLLALIVTAAGWPPSAVSYAADVYPYQAMRLENVNSKTNLNILGYANNAEVNVWP
ncbi:hypothetical protein BZG21_44170, partial [Escherichia coli]|nr:hypothetical protein [Escherichia coli]